MTILEIVKLAKEFRYALPREDLTNLIKSLRKVLYVKVDPNGTSSECPICNYKGLEEVGYRRLRCPRCGFEADRDATRKLNVRKRGLRKLGIYPLGGSGPHYTSNDRCKPE